MLENSNQSTHREDNQSKKGLIASILKGFNSLIVSTKLDSHVYSFRSRIKEILKKKEEALRRIFKAGDETLATDYMYKIKQDIIQILKSCNCFNGDEDKDSIEDIVASLSQDQIDLLSKRITKTGTTSANKYDSLAINGFLLAQLVDKYKYLVQGLESYKTKDKTTIETLKNMLKKFKNDFNKGVSIEDLKEMLEQIKLFTSKIKVYKDDDFPDFRKRFKTED